MAKQAHSVQVISYGDLTAQLFLWQKAFMLVPIWGIAAIPVVGFICRSFGHVASEIGYAVMLCVCLNYFFVDLLRRKVRADDDYIYFGYRMVPIRELISAEVTYKKGKLLPSYLTLRSAVGNDLKLNLNGMSESAVAALLKHLETRNSNLKTAPVLNTLIKCRQSKRKLALETVDRIQLPYHSKKIFDESYEVFKASASHWVRVGPILTMLCFGPLWVGFFSNMYTCLQPNSWYQLQSLSLHTFLSKFFDALSRALATKAGQVSEAVQHFSGNPVMIAITCGAILVFFFYLQRIALKPNRLFADKNSLRLMLKAGSLVIPMQKVLWSQIVQASLFKPGNDAGSQNWKIRLLCNNGKKFDIELSALTHDDRTILLKRLEQMVPNCQIDYELQQSMRPHAAHSYTEIWLQSLNQAPERKTLDPLQPGQMVGDDRFEVLRSIGVGGQGTAYLCRAADKSMGTVVLKETIIPVFVDESLRRKSLESVEKETRLLKSLNSPHIVKLIDHFIEDHRAYLVLEHIDGSSLRTLIEENGPLSQAQTHDLALQMCEILKVLHANGIVHRDFTPDNLILNSKGQLKLIDFNVAQQVQAGSTGTIVGKHAYLPPEQFRGKATNQSDLYAFGACLFFMLTGRDPEPISQSSPHAVNESINNSLNSIVKKSTALQTNNRYASAEEIEKELLAMPETDEHHVIYTERSAKEKVAEHG